MSRYVAFIFLSLSLFIFPAIAQAEHRVALVIGNSDYQHASKLANPANDARLMETTLKRLNFEVIAATDLTQKGMKRAISNFARTLRARGADTIGLVFFAGHGVQVNGFNYLIPVDAKITSESDVAIESIAANDLLYAMNQAGNRVNIITFDACRDNPYRSLFRSNKAGLAIMNAPRGSLISFATAPGDVASDGVAKNSPFTAALSKHLLTPGITIERVLKLVGRDVQRSTGRKQRPWWNRDIYDDLYLAGRSKKNNKKQGTQTGSVTPKCSAQDEALWARVQREKTKPAYEYYLSQFPKGCYAAVAKFDLRQKLASIQKLNKPGSKPLTQNTVGVYFNHGTKFQDCPECPKMVVLRGDSFTMGSLQSEKGRDNDEGPHRTVHIKKFAVGRFQVTVGEYQVCVDAGDCPTPHWKETGNTYNIRTGSKRDYYGKLGSALTAKNHPIVGISWNDAKSYVRWLSRKTGKTYRLLTEAEWEYAAGAKRYTMFWWGSSIVTGLYNDNRNRTVSVDRFDPNPFGLYNVVGNVYEWVEDCWHKNYRGAPTDGSAWLSENGGQCGSRILRGSAWGSSPRALRTRNRGSANLDYRDNVIGFRVARTL